MGAHFDELNRILRFIDVGNEEGAANRAEFEHENSAQIVIFGFTD